MAAISTPIQHVVFPIEAEVAPLYLRAEAAEAGGRILAAADLPRWERRVLEVPAGVAVSLDTLFNHLPEAYWTHHSAIRDFAFTAAAAGQGQVQVWRRDQHGGNTLLGVHDVADARPASFSLPVTAPETGGGTLFVRVVSAGHPVRLAEARWEARGVAPASVRLVAGYCTFRREAQVLDNLRTILADGEACAGLDALVVVDQGRSDQLAEAVALLEGPLPVHLVRQGNLGGSGGFTRVILEALERPDATHVLLLDDDARMEPESIFRAAAFLSFCPGKALGGQMLDLVAPLRIFEQGSSLDSATLAFTRGHGDLCPVGPQGITPFATVRSCHWNGWWFFAAPLAVIRDCGLPLPLFLRYDDVEYGTRLLRRGTETVALPGIAVWHEPFYLNVGGWQGYFDARNFLAIASIHHGLNRGRALGHVIRSVLGALVTYDYGRAWLYCQGAADWLRGPATLEADPEARLAHLRSLAARFAPGGVGADEVDPGHGPAIAAPPGRGGQVRALVWICVKTLMERDRPPASAPLPGLPPARANWWVLSFYRDVAIAPVHPRLGSGWKRLHRSPRLFRALFARLALLAFGIALGGGRAARRWRVAADGLSTITHWRRRLAT